MKRPRPPHPSSGNSSGGNVGKNRSVEFIVLLGISCLLLTYGVSTLRAVSNLPSPYQHETNTGSINSAPRSTNDAQKYDYSRQKPQQRLGQRVVSDGDDHDNHATKHNERGMQVDVNYDAREQIDDGSDGTTFPISTRSTEHYETIVHPAPMIANNNRNLLIHMNEQKDIICMHHNICNHYNTYESSQYHTGQMVARRGAKVWDWKSEIATEIFRHLRYSHRIADGGTASMPLRR